MASIPPLVLIGAGILCLGNLIHIIGLATTHWMELDALGLSYGLFKVCNDDGDCKDYPEKNQSSSLEATQAMMIMGMLGGLVAAGLAILFVVFNLLSKTPPKIFTILCMAAGAGAFVLIIIGVIIFGADVYDSKFADLGYSFGLCITGAILLAAGSLLVMVGGKSVE